MARLTTGDLLDDRSHQAVARMEGCALPPQVPQQHLPIVSDIGDASQVHDRLSTLLGRKVRPAAFQFLNPGTGKATFQPEPHWFTRTVRRDPQHSRIPAFNLPSVHRSRTDIFEHPTSLSPPTAQTHSNDRSLFHYDARNGFRVVNTRHFHQCPLARGSICRMVPTDRSRSFGMCRLIGSSPSAIDLAPPIHPRCESYDKDGMNRSPGSK